MNLCPECGRPGHDVAEYLPGQWSATCSTCTMPGRDGPEPLAWTWWDDSIGR